MKNQFNVRKNEMDICMESTQQTIIMKHARKGFWM